MVTATRPGLREREAQRTVLVVSGAYDALPAIAHARALGFRVLVADGTPDAPGFREADAGFLAAVDDPDATVDAARAYASRTPIDAVLAVGVDAPSTVGAVAEALGLPGIGRTATSLLADKLAVKARLGMRGIRAPRHTMVNGVAALEALARDPARPLVVKPADGRDGQGIVRLLPGVDPQWAFQTAALASPSGRVLAEELLSAEQARAIVLVADRTVVHVALADRRHVGGDHLSPFVVEDGVVLPSLRPVAAIGPLVETVVDALDVEWGVLTVDLALEAGGPVVLDVSPRLAGGVLATHAMPLATGVDVLAAALALASGEPPPAGATTPRWSRGVAERRLHPASGIVVAVQGAEEAAQGDGVALVEVRARLGSRIRALPERVPAGIVVAVAEEREEAVRRADAAAARVRIVTRPATAPASSTMH